MTGDNAKQDALKSNVDAANLWSFYQAKSIRQTTLRTEAERLEIDMAGMQSRNCPKTAPKLASHDRPL